MEVVEIKGGTQSEKSIAVKVIDWCFEKGIVTKSNIDINMEILEDNDCWGSCIESDGIRLDTEGFDITISNEQSVRDFIATIMHEMIHVNQYITGEWEGDGEKEAEDRQYKLTDKFLKEILI